MTCPKVNKKVNCKLESKPNLTLKGERREKVVEKIKAAWVDRERCKPIGKDVKGIQGRDSWAREETWTPFPREH